MSLSGRQIGVWPKMMGQGATDGRGLGWRDPKVGLSGYFLVLMPLDVNGGPRSTYR